MLFDSLLRPSLALRADTSRHHPSLPARRCCDNQKIDKPAMTE